MGDGDEVRSTTAQYCLSMVREVVAQQTALSSIMMLKRCDRAVDDFYSVIVFVSTQDIGLT